MSFFKNLSLRTQLLIMPICSVIVFTLILFLLNLQIEKIIITDNNQYSDILFSQIKHRVNSNCDIYNRVLISLAYNNVVQDYITATDMRVKYDAFIKIDNLVLNTVGIKEGIEDVVFLSDISKSYFYRGENEELIKIIESVPVGSVNYYTGTYYLRNVKYNGFYYIVATTIYSTDQSKGTGYKIGMAALVINTEQLGFNYDEQSEKNIAKYYLTDRNNIIYSSNDLKRTNTELHFKVVSSNNLQQYNEVIIDDKKSFVKVDSLPQIGGKIISLIPKKGLLANLIKVRENTYTFLIIAIILILVPFSIIIKNILRPLRKLTVFINSIKSGQLEQLKKEIHLEGYHEIRLMSSEFNNMLKEIDNLTHRLLSTNSKLYESELGKKMSELSYLRSQINPHFLYNTLETIRGVAVCEKAENTILLLKSLAQMFRYCVIGEDSILLGEEVQIIKSYIHIQSIRFKERFTVLYEFGDEIIELSIPKMILQPIVENAFNHGLVDMEENGILIIGGRVENDVLQIWVKDNGKGIEKRMLESLSAKLMNDKNTSDTIVDNYSSIGIANVNNRIKLIYGDEYGVTVNSELGKGTDVLMCFPLGRNNNA